MGMITRDGHEMVKFAEVIDNYSIEFKRVCTGLNSELEDSAKYLRDEITRGSITQIKNEVEELLRGLPFIKEAADRLKKAGKIVIQAEEEFNSK